LLMHLSLASLFSWTDVVRHLSDKLEQNEAPGCQWLKSGVFYALS
jgi:hypothetical protein